MFGNFLGNFENLTFLSQTVVATFWATLVKLGLLFIPTSGHTAATADNKKLPLCGNVQSLLDIVSSIFYARCPEMAVACLLACLLRFVH